MTFSQQFKSYEGYEIVRFVMVLRAVRNGSVIITSVGLDRLRIPGIAVTQLCAFTSSLIV